MNKTWHFKSSAGLKNIVILMSEYKILSGGACECIFHEYTEHVALIIHLLYFLIGRHVIFDTVALFKKALE